MIAEKEVKDGIRLFRGMTKAHREFDKDDVMIPKSTHPYFRGKADAFELMAKWLEKGGKDDHGNSWAVRIAKDKMKGHQGQLIDILATAVKLGMKYLPDGKHYDYCWDECTSDEQEKVKEVRAELSKVLELYEKKARGNTKP